MIYCNLSNLSDHRSVTLSAPRLFAGSVTDASGGFADAMKHPIQNIPVTTAGSLGNNPAHANQGIWLGADDLAGKDSVLVPGLRSCAAVLFYDAGFVLIGAGHAAGGFINNEIMTQITNTIPSGLCGFPWRIGKEMGYKAHLLYRWLCIPLNGYGHSGYDRKHFISIDCGGICFFP